MAHLIEKHYDDYNSFDSNRALYLPGGAAPAVGSLFRQPDLAQALQFMAEEDRAAAAKAGREAGLQAARDAFYKGDLAATMAAFHRKEGGLLTRDDLAGFSVGIEEPASITFGDATIYGCGPWCQGPMLLQALKILEGFDLRALGHNSADYLHLIVEALKLAAADRERYIGDPRFLEVPLERLLSGSYAASRRQQIDPRKAWPDLPPPGGEAEAKGSRPGAPNADAAMDTSYVCAVDKDGNVFSATPSDGSFKSPVVPGLGMVLSPRGQQSWADPAHPSCVAPGKRPRLTPNPAIAVTRDSIIPFGSPGGDVQTQAMLQTLLNHLVFGFDVQQAVELPRVASYSFPSSFEPHRSEPGVLRVEARLPEQVVEGLADKGHKIDMWDDFSWLAGAVSMIDADIAQGARRAAADPRRMGYALAY
jgi:gamma-glutamyltranspeptidase / glutathione hydrolase